MYCNLKCRISLGKEEAYTIFHIFSPFDLFLSSFLLSKTEKNRDVTTTGVVALVRSPAMDKY